MHGPGSKRGVALIIVLAVLALLTALAAAFAAIQATERNVSRNYLDTVRARLAAHAGVQDAIARLREIASGEGFIRDTRWIAAEEQPSFALSSRLSTGTYVKGGDAFRLRVTDASSRINVNDGVKWGSDHAVSRNLRRILNILGEQPGVDVTGLGDLLLDARPPGGYRAPADFLPALGRDAWRRARRFLTVDSWSDDDVAHPVPLSEAVARPPFTEVDFFRPGGVYRHGHQRNARGEAIEAPLLFYDPSFGGPRHHAVWGRDSLNPRWIEIVSRSPVNVNTAPREVLIALLVDLEGFFLLERRRPIPSAYAWAGTRYTYDASGDEGDECGFLYRTVPFTGPGGRSPKGIPAELVADEIIACRARRASPWIDYASTDFGGPFRDWPQFNAFVDALVTHGLLADPRNWLFPEGPGRRIASQAIGDVLKANFNPNLHLNEINPDRNLFTHVDKTDLLVHSTEFCFIPMGAFEIESLGRILRPSGVAAEQRVVARVRLFDAVRQSVQRDFQAGTFSERRPGPETNNNWSLETGPEPDNGPAPAENGYEGYVRLPTVGGNLFRLGRHKPCGALWTTLSDPSHYPGAATSPLPASGHLGSCIHAHFQLDHAAHHHASLNSASSPPRWDGFRMPQGAWWGIFGKRAAVNLNWEDRGDALHSPYSPVDSTRGSRDYRIARSFTLPDIPERSFAPGDLRVDGVYVERDSAFGYWIEEGVSFSLREGTAAFWFKPAFDPETSGKSRTLLSASRYHAHAGRRLNPSPFGIFYIPSPPGGTLWAERYGNLRPNALAFGLGFSNATGYAWETGGSPTAARAFTVTPTLSRGPLHAHTWMHVAVTWRLRPGRVPDADTVRLYINGRILPGSRGWAHSYPSGEDYPEAPPWAIHARQVHVPGGEAPVWCANTIRLGGEPSRILGEFCGLARNWSADATFDEFYLWRNRLGIRNGGLAGLRTLWERGRYYRPDDGNPEDACFTSHEIPLRRPGVRFPPPAATIADPSGKRPPPPVEASPASPSLLGVAWTGIAPSEGILPEAPPDANGFTGPAAADLHVMIGDVLYGPFRDGGYSAVRTPSGRAPECRPFETVRYRAKLRAGPGEILLSTPVLDDVTLYFDPGRPEVLGWIEERTGAW